MFKNMNHFCLFPLFTLNTEPETKEHFKGLSYIMSEGTALLFTIWHSVAYMALCIVYAGYAMLYDDVCMCTLIFHFRYSQSK